MKVTQEFVDKIIARARASQFGLDKGQGHNQIDQYADPDLNALGMLLINGWDAKYDLISVVVAALEMVEEEAGKKQKLTN